VTVSGRDSDSASDEGAYLVDLGGGRFAVRSDLTFEFVTAILSQSAQLFESWDQISVDLSDVREADSAGLALLIEWVSWAKHHECEIVYENIPAQLLSIAEISEVSGILPSPQ
jgi:phospholipid transport system transporter-binding protein